MAERRKDSRGRVLKENESQRKDGSYDYRWRTSDGKRHSVYATTLDELREKVKDISKDTSDGIRVSNKKITLNNVFNLWLELKKGLKPNTRQNYIYMYKHFVENDIGNQQIATLKKSDIRRFYNRLIDDRGLKVATVDNIHTIIHQVIDIAVEDGYLRTNICDKALKELKQSRNLFTEKKKALTVDEQTLFLDFIKNNDTYKHWYPVFALMLGTGLRVGEATGLRWEDVNFDDNLIDVNHTLVYYQKEQGISSFGINTPKTRSGYRTVPMIESVKEALIQEKNNQEETGIMCSAKIDGYTNFIFVNRFGNTQNYSTLNKALRRIIRDCNNEILDRADENEEVLLLPHFSCHVLRHTFTTRLCESGINIKVIQTVLGHADVSTTLDVYADVTKDLKKAEMINFEDFINKKGLV